MLTDALPNIDRQIIIDTPGRFCYALDMAQRHITLYLDDEILAYLEAYAKQRGMKSRNAAIVAFFREAFQIDSTKPYENGMFWKDGKWWTMKSWSRNVLVEQVKRGEASETLLAEFDRKHGV